MLIVFTVYSLFIGNVLIGAYFGNHFFMGGKKFETAQPESYLFGDNSDLNYLGPKPHNVSVWLFITYFSFRYL